MVVYLKRATLNLLKVHSTTRSGIQYFFSYSVVNGLGDLWNYPSCISPNQEIMTCRKTDRETSKGVYDSVLLTQLRLIKYNDGIYTLGFLLCLREDLKKTNK